MSADAAPSGTVLERTRTGPPKIHPTAHWWHSGCQGKGPGPKICYCGARITVKGRSDNWTGKVTAEDCVVCTDLIEAGQCPVCSKDII